MIKRVYVIFKLPSLKNKLYNLSKLNYEGNIKSMFAYSKKLSSNKKSSLLLLKNLDNCELEELGSKGIKKPAKYWNKCI